MSIRSQIAMKDGNKVYSIYCHSDGSPDHNGKILNEHYTNPRKVKQLMELGALSGLGNEIGQKVDWKEFRNIENKDWTNSLVCLSCHRDRGDKKIDTEAQCVSWKRLELIENNMTEWFYIFLNDKWLTLETQWRYDPLLTPHQIDTIYLTNEEK